MNVEDSSADLVIPFAHIVTSESIESATLGFPQLVKQQDVCTGWGVSDQVHTRRQLIGIEGHSWSFSVLPAQGFLDLGLNDLSASDWLNTPTQGCSS